MNKEPNVSELKTVRFTEYKHHPYYDCDGNAGHSGEYVKAEKVRELVKALQACRKVMAEKYNAREIRLIESALSKITKGPTP
jgi:hypothetical protein